MSLASLSGAAFADSGQAAGDILARSVIPLAVYNKYRRPEHVATGILLRVDGRHFVHHAHVRFFRPPANGRHTGPIGRPNGIRRRALLRPCGLKTRGRPSPRRLPGGKRESSGFSDRREANAEAVTAVR